jgi:hypothetical protein
MFLVAACAHAEVHLQQVPCDNQLRRTFTLSRSGVGIAHSAADEFWLYHPVHGRGRQFAPLLPGLWL